MRNTRQKEEVLNAVLISCDHPAAEAVYLKVKKSLPNISLGTVYRNLQTLAAQKLIRQVHVAGAADRYDKTLERHAHFYCQACGAVCDIGCESAADTEICRQAERASGHKIHEMELIFYGMCKSCRKNKNS